MCTSKSLKMVRSGKSSRRPPVQGKTPPVTPMAGPTTTSQTAGSRKTIDLSDYAGKKIFVRFEYVTDAAVNGEGMLIDDVSVDAIGYFTDFEFDDGGWVTDGFVRVQNALPQTFRLALIKEGSTTTVEMIEVSEDQTAEIPISIGGDVDSVTLVISGTTRFTREVGSYTVEIK